MTPRRSLLVGLIFVVIAAIYASVQGTRAGPSTRRRHDAAGARRRDVDHDLRAVRRPPAELTTTPAMTTQLEQIWSQLISWSTQYVVPDWGSLIGLIPILLADPGLPVRHLDDLPLRDRRPDAPRQAPDRAGAAPGHPHAGPVVRAAARRVRLLHARVRAGHRRVLAVDRPRDPRPSRSSTGAARRCATTTTSRPRPRPWSRPVARGLATRGPLPPGPLPTPPARPPRASTSRRPRSARCSSRCR